MNTTNNTVEMLGTLNTTEGYELAKWCRKQAVALAKLSRDEQQKAIRGWIGQRKAR